MKNLTQGWATPGAAPKVAISPPAPARGPWTPPAALPVGKPKSLRVRKSVLDASQKLAQEGDRAYGARQYDTAIERYEKAIATWPSHHTAWYGIALARAQKREWDKAADAMANALAIDPTIAMYHLFHGRALYEKVIAQGREDVARRMNQRPENVTPDFSVLNFEKPLASLSQALRLDPDLWRAHYLIGKILGYMDRPKDAASELLKAVNYGPTDEAPWVALVELYRSWDYTDQAIQIATTGAAITSGSDVWLEVGLGYDDKQMWPKAIEAYTKALDLRPDNPRARFARGQDYYRQGDHAKAKSDLEAFAKSPGGNEFFKRQASSMLMDIAAKSVRQP
jgi:tetratricopeptide (TPR) repeat protein